MLRFYKRTINTKENVRTSQDSCRRRIGKLNVIYTRSEEKRKGQSQRRLGEELSSIKLAAIYHDSKRKQLQSTRLASISAIAILVVIFIGVNTRLLALVVEVAGEGDLGLFSTGASGRSSGLQRLSRAPVGHMVWA